MSKFTLALMGLTALSLGCKDKDCDSGGCDTGIEDTDPGDPSVSISWPNDSTLTVTVTDLAAGVFGMAQTGAGNEGWYGEDCVTGSHCHAVIEGTNSLTSVHPDVGGGGIDDVVSSSTTLLHGGLASEVTYAVWDISDVCVHCSGDDCGYYSDSGC